MSWNRQKRHSDIHYETQLITLTAGFLNPTAQSQQHSRVPLLPWFCARVQNENETQSREFWTAKQTKSTVGSSHVALQTDLPFIGGGTERPASDRTQHCLSVGKGTLKLECLELTQGFNGFSTCNLCVGAAVCFCRSSAQLSSAAGMSCVHSCSYNHKVIY